MKEMIFEDNHSCADFLKERHWHFRMGVVHVNDSESKLIEFKENSVMLENGNQI